MLVPPDAVAAARSAQTQTGASDTAVALALAVAFPESGYDSNAQGDWMVGGRIVPRGTPGAIPTSFGYTQLHNNDGGDAGGLGNGYSGAQLVDPVLNFRIAEQAIQARLDAGADQLGAIGPWSTRHAAIGLVGDTLQALGEQPAVGSPVQTAPTAPADGTAQAVAPHATDWLVPAGFVLAALWLADVI